MLSALLVNKTATGIHGNRQSRQFPSGMFMDSGATHELSGATMSSLESLDHRSTNHNFRLCWIYCCMGRFACGEAEP